MLRKFPPEGCDPLENAVGPAFTKRV